MPARTGNRDAHTGGAMNAGKRVLLLEDDPAVAQAVRLHLRNDGYAVEHANNAAEGVRLIERGRWDALLLHHSLPGADLPGMVRRVREMERYLPIIASGTQSDEIDRIVALEMGADDYLIRPFSVHELATRLKALLRLGAAFARNAAIESRHLQVDGLFIDPRAREVRLGRRAIALTPREFDLLHFLARHPGWVFSRLELLHQVWGYRDKAYEHTVNTHINRLRIKVEARPAKPQRIVTVWGRGYKLATRSDAAWPQ